ncbi:unnamed protein product [Closterium sp. NIES-65]|nr:unnamed protein product [Closterium sp. NIES-65]
MEWLTSAKGLNARQELEASVREHHPNLRDEEVDLIVDGCLLCLVRERAAEQAPASGQQGGTGEGGAVHEAPSAVGVGGGALAPTIDTGMIGASYGQFKFRVEHISVTPLLEGRHDLTAKGDDETAESYCNRACTIRAELLTIGQEVHMATFAAHVLKGLPPEYGFLRRNKLEISSPDMTVECVCSEVLMEEQTLSIEQRTKANLVSLGQLLGKGAKLRTEEGVTRIIASGGQVAAKARYRHRLYCLDLKPGPARNGATAAAACNGTATAAACTDMAGGAARNSTGAASACNGRAAAAACNGMVAAAICSNTAAIAACNGTAAEVACNGMPKAFTEVVSSTPEANDEAASLTTYAVGTEAMLNLWRTHFENDHAGAVQWTATNSGMLGMDLEKGGEETSSASSQEAKLTRQMLLLPDEREGEVLGMVHGPEHNQPPSCTIIIIPVPSVQGGKQPSDRSVDPAGSNATIAPLALCPSLVAGLAPVGPKVGAADEDKEGEAADLKLATTHGKDPIPTVPPLQPTPPPPCHSSRSNKGMPPVRLPASTMTALDAVDGNNMYGIAFLARGAYGTNIYYDVEYLDEGDEEEGGLRSVIINLGATLTGPEGKVVDKGLVVVEYMSFTEGYLGLQIVRDRPNKTLLLHENAYVAKVQQRFFKGAPLKKQPITPLSSTSFVMEDAELFADRTMTDRLAAGAHLRTNAHWH